MPILFPENTARKLDALMYTVAIIALCAFASISFIPPVVVPFMALLAKPVALAIADRAVKSKNRISTYLVDEYNFYVFYSKVQSKIGKKIPQRC